MRSGWLGLSLVLIGYLSTGCRNAQSSSRAEDVPQQSRDGSLGYNAREGKALFEHYCATCHGAEGTGDGFNAYSLDPKPRDLTDPGFHGARTDADIAAVIRSGGGAAGLSPGMPPWGRTLNDRQIYNLIAYVRRLPEAANADP